MPQVDHYSKHLGIGMRENCLALAVFVFLAASQCQGSNSVDSPLGVGLSLEDIVCNEPIQFGSEMLEAARLATFKIDVKNNETEPLRNIEIFAIMPMGFKYLGSSHSSSDLKEADIAESLEPEVFDEKQKTKIGWNIGGLQENENRSIFVRMIFKCKIDNAQIKLLALGDASDRIVSGTDTWEESLGECECLSITKNEASPNEASPLKINASLLNETMGDWIQFSPAKTELSRLGIYEINVKNTGEKSVEDLVVFIVLPKGMKYMNSRYSEAVQDKPDVIVEPQEFNETQITNITWNVGTLQANEFKSILINSYLRCPVSKTYIKLAAIGEVAGQSAIASENESIELTDYDCYKENIDISLQVWEANNNTSAYFGNDDPKPAKLEIYHISVTNGEIPLQNVKVIAELPLGMMFINSSYYAPMGEKLDVKVTPNQDDYDENRKTNLVCNIDDLSPWEAKTIILAVFLKKDIKEMDISAMVQGYSPYLPENEPIIVFADPASNACPDRSIGGAEVSEAVKAILSSEDIAGLQGKDLIKTDCFSWTKNINIPILLQSHEATNK
ncbi:MAG: hypothetical protein ACP5PV_01015 [Methanothrix sp.]